MATVKLPETNSGVVTSWMPLTTAYPAVRGCDQLYWSVVANTVAAWDPGYGLFVADSSCLPKAATTWWDQDKLGKNTETVMSIGPVTCPQAYYTARTSVKDSSSTLVGCCPIGYTFASFLGNGNTGQCVSNFDAGQVFTYAIQDASKNWIITTKTVASKTTVAGIPINGWAFAQETGTAASTACAAAATTTVTSSASAEPNAGLSSGAKAGIGIGVALGVVGLLTLLAGLWMMRRFRRRESDYGSAAMVQEQAPGYTASPEGWALGTAATPGSKTGTTTGVMSTDGTGYNNAIPHSAYTQDSYRTSPSHFGGSTLGGMPVELSEERPTELPASPTPYSDPAVQTAGHGR